MDGPKVERGALAAGAALRSEPAELHGNAILVLRCKVRRVDLEVEGPSRDPEVGERRGGTAQGPGQDGFRDPWRGDDLEADPGARRAACGLGGRHRGPGGLGS